MTCPKIPENVPPTDKRAPFMLCWVNPGPCEGSVPDEPEPELGNKLRKLPPGNLDEVQLMVGISAKRKMIGITNFLFFFDVHTTFRFCWS